MIQKIMHLTKIELICCQVHIYFIYMLFFE